MQAGGERTRAEPYQALVRSDRRKNASLRAVYLEDLMELYIKAVSSMLVAKHRNRDLTLWLVFELNGLILC